jgi:hypothetical protein
VSSNLEVGTANLFVDTVNSRVGLGKTNPDTALDVVGTVTATALVGTNLYGTLLGSNAASVSSLTASGTVKGTDLIGTNLYGTLLGSNAASVSSLTASGTVKGVDLIGTNLYGTLLGSNAASVSTLTASGDVAFDTNTLFVDSTENRVGIGTVTPRADLDVVGTGAIIVPSGTTDQQPTGVNGMLRYNSTTGYMEAYTVSGWGSIATPPTIQTFSPTSVAGGDVTTQVFTVTGAFFDAQTTIQLQGADNTLYDVTGFVFTNSGSIGFKMGTLASGQAANRPFKVVVTNGAGLEATSTATISLLPPTITNVSPTTITGSAVGSQTFTVLGTNLSTSMASGNNIQVLGADGSTLYNVDSAAVVHTGRITFKLAATSGSLSSGQLANRPYKVRVTGSAGFTATSTATIGFSGLSWTSPAAGATLSTFFTDSSANNTELAATDDVGGSGVTFSLVSANLPSGLTVNGITGAITGTIGAATAAGGVSVTFRVTDNVSGTTLDRTFSIVGVAPLYPFGSSFTFTNASATGHTGPTLTNLTDTYTPSWTDNTNYLNVTAGIQEWTVPAAGSYTITAAGAGGQDHGLGGGRGRIVRRTVVLNGGEVIKILVGQVGTSSVSTDGNSGGGGTFVMKTPYNSTASVLVIAGGGGAQQGPGWGTQFAGGDAQSTGATPRNTSAGYGANYGGGGSGAGSNGGGLLSDGTSGGLHSPQHNNGSSGLTLTGGRGFINGGNGGITNHTGGGSSTSYGGFGGGGVTYYGNRVLGGGAGGGYTGGAAGHYNVSGGEGGGSYYPGGTDQGLGSRGDDGYVTILKN